LIIIKSIEENDRAFLFPSPALPGSGSKGVISACFYSAYGG